MDSTHSHLYDAAKVPVVDGDYEKGQPELARDDTPVKRDHSNVPGLKGRALRTMDFLVRHGVEERGIEPTPEDVGRRYAPLTPATGRSRVAQLHPPDDLLGCDEHEYSYSAWGGGFA